MVISSASRWCEQVERTMAPEGGGWLAYLEVAMTLSFRVDVCVFFDAEAVVAVRCPCCSWGP